MTAIAASNVSVSILNQRKYEKGFCNRCRITVGNGALTYPAGGIPLTIGKFGMKATIESMSIVDAASNVYDFKYDQSANKLLVLSRSHTHNLHLNNGEAADAAGTRVNAATNLLGANSGADVLVAGVDDVSGHGGVVKHALGEITGVAMAQQVVEVEVRGW